jgi:tetratricopeptide (TPR) repeat protein
LKPGHLGTINDLASLYGKAGRFNDELALLRDSLSHTDQKDDLMLHLLHLYLVHGNYADAEQIVTTHTFAPKHRDYQLRDEYRALKYAETAQAFAKRDYATALKLVDEVENPPASLGVDDFQFASTPQMDYSRGRILEALGRKAEADEAYDKCVKSVDLKSGEMESFAGSNFYIVLALNKLGQHQEAEKVAAQFETYARTQLDLQRSTRKANGHYTLGLIALFHGDKKTAESEMHLALKAEPDFLPPIFDLRGDAIGTALVAK